MLLIGSSIQVKEDNNNLH